MLKPEKKLIQKLERAIKSEGLPTSYKFCSWLLTSLVNSRDPFFNVTKDDIQRKVRVNFSENMSEEIEHMSDHSFTSYRNCLVNLGFIKVTGAVKSEWSQGNNIKGYIDEIKRVNQLDVNVEIDQLKIRLAAAESKLDAVIRWCESDPLTPEKVELKKILKGSK